MIDKEQNRKTDQDDDGAVCRTPMCERGRFGPQSLCQLVLIIFFILMAVVAAHGQVLKDDPNFGGDVDVIEHLGESIPLDIPFINTDGDTVTLAAYIQDDLPVLMVLHYSDCPMLCGLVLSGVSKALYEMPLVPGKDYRIVTISVDPAETIERARATEKRYRSELRDGAASSAWSFLVGSQGSIDRLTEALGFKYFWDEKNKQYSHPAVVQVVTPRGAISRYLYGIEFSPNDLRFALLEASEGKVGSTVDRILLYCMHYDPDSEGYVVLAANVMKLGGAATLLVLAIVLGGLWVRDRALSGHEAVSSNEKGREET